MLQGRCGQEEFNSFRREWQRYVRYYRKVDANEVGTQLLNCLDRALQLFVHRDLGSNAGNATQADMLRVIELLVVEDMYENLDVKNDALYPTNVEVFANRNTVEVVNEDMKQEVVLKLDILHLSNGKCGGLGGANEKQIPKTIVRLEENLEKTLKETLE